MGEREETGEGGTQKENERDRGGRERWERGTKEGRSKRLCENERVGSKK